jgi:hypothetical protein
MRTRQRSCTIDRGEAIYGAEADAWIDNEVVGCGFPDVRHGKRLRQLLEQLSSRGGNDAMGLPGLGEYEGQRGTERGPHRS